MKQYVILTALISGVICGTVGFLGGVLLTNPSRVRNELKINEAIFNANKPLKDQIVKLNDKCIFLENKCELLSEENKRYKLEEQVSLDIKNVFKKSSISKTIINPYNLEIGQIYSLSEETLLMPTFEMESVAETVFTLERGDTIYIISLKMQRDVPWYFVETKFGKGWINSLALVGQKIGIL